MRGTAGSGLAEAVHSYLAVGFYLSSGTFGQLAARANWMMWSFLEVVQKRQDGGRDFQRRSERGIEEGGKSTAWDSQAALELV